MECIEVKNLIVDRIDGTLSEELTLRIDNHLEKCQDCQEEYIQVGKLLNTISKTTDEQPPSSLKSNFYEMLNNESLKSYKDDTDKKVFVSRRQFISIIKYAASIIILVSIGYFAGNQSKWKAETSTEIAALKQEIKQMQHNAYLISLSKPSASERLKTVNTVGKAKAYDKELIKALVNTLNTDDNVNVRMAAAYALAKFPKDEFVKLSLIQSLEIQTEPIIQISLIGILMDFKDERAKPAIEKIIENETVLPEVKKYAQAGLSVFM